MLNRARIWYVAKVPTWNSLITSEIPGLTETFTAVALSSDDQKIATPASAGVLIPGIVARVVKPDGTLAKLGEPGELLVRGPSMALGYYKNPEA